MKHKPRIALITYSLQGGGAERTAVNLAYYLKSQGYVMDIILFKNINDYEEQYKKLPNDISVIPLLQNKTKIPVFKLPFAIAEIIFKLLNLVKNNKYKVIIGGMEYHPFYFSILLKLLCKTRAILIVVNNIDRDLNEKSLPIKMFHKILIKLSFTVADKIICKSKGLQSDLNKNYRFPPGKLETIYNGINNNEIRIAVSKRTPQKLGDNLEKAKIIVSCGRLAKQKGHIHLIRSFKRIKDAVPDAKLLIMGKGPLERKLKLLVNKLNLNQDVLMPGFIKDNPYKYFKLGKIFVFSSLYESFGNVIIEAMSCGLPVISTDCPYGPREIVDGNDNYPAKALSEPYFAKYGVLTPAFTDNPGKAEKNTVTERIFADALITLLKNSKILNQYKKMSMMRARDFSLTQMGEGYKRIIDNLIK